MNKSQVVRKISAAQKNTFERAARTEESKKRGAEDFNFTTDRGKPETKTTAAAKGQSKDDKDTEAGAEAFQRYYAFNWLFSSPAFR